MTVATEPERILDWEGCFNVRDLGGLKAENGARIAWGALIRSDLPVRLTERGRQALLDHGVTPDRRPAVRRRSGTWIGTCTHSRAGTMARSPAYRNVPFHEWGERGPR